MMQPEQALTQFVADKGLSLSESEQERLREVAGPLLSVGRSKGFLIDFDKVWKWLEYSQKGNAKLSLQTNFVESEDFQIEEADPVSHKTCIMLTSECFDAFCMMSNKPKARLIRRFFTYIKYLVQDQLHHGVQREEIGTSSSALKRRREELELRSFEAKTLKEEAEALQAKTSAFVKVFALINENFGTDDRDKIFFKDSVKRILQQRRALMLVDSDSDSNSNKIEHVRVANDGRGEEISIPISRDRFGDQRKNFAEQSFFNWETYGSTLEI